jgi:hypothetical protein
MVNEEIEGTQEDTIHIVSKLIHAGYNMREELTRAIEEHLDMPHSKDN